MKNRWIAAVVVLACVSGCRRAPDSDRDRTDIQQVFNKYLQSVNTADVTIASEVWLQSPDVLVVTPFGRFNGWESVRNDIYVNFLQKGFTERNLQPSHVTIRIEGDAAWVVYDWVFTAKRSNGEAATSKGWESHGYERTDQGWRIVHLHYSVPPPRP